MPLRTLHLKYRRQNIYGQGPKLLTGWRLPRVLTTLCFQAAFVKDEEALEASGKEPRLKAEKYTVPTFAWMLVVWGETEHTQNCPLELQLEWEVEGCEAPAASGLKCDDYKPRHNKKVK